MRTIARTFLTPPQVAERLGVSAEKVIGWLLAGELKGSNLATLANGRPRYRISENDLSDFLQSRSASVATVASTRPNRRRRTRPGVKEFF